MADVFSLQGFQVPLIVADPPYGQIVKESWDKHWNHTDYLKLATLAHDLLSDGGVFYCWGGIGKPHKRHFFRFLAEVEEQTPLTIHNLITWSKKRAYGVQDNYLFTREECVILRKGDKLKTFHVPYLAEKREGKHWNAEYPPHSEFKRRTNVWQETELLSGKRHPCEKPPKVCEIPILAHTNPGDWVLDLFAGSGSTSEAAHQHGRNFLAVELDKTYAKAIAHNTGAKLLSQLPGSPARPRY